MSEKQPAGLKGRSLLVFIVYYIAYSSIYVARSNFSIASALLESMGVLSITQIGLIGGIFSAVYAVMKIPSGYIGDRVPVRLIMGAGLTVTELSNLLIGFFPTFWSIAILWGMNACGQSVLWGPMLRAINEHYGPERGKVLCQRVITSCTIGSMVGTLLAGRCSTALGAAACFLIPGAIVLAVAIMVWVMLGKHSVSRQKEEKKVQPMSFGALLRDKNFQGMTLPAFLYGVVRNNVSGWMAIYYMDKFGIDLAAVSFFVFVMPAFSFVSQSYFPRVCRLVGNEYRTSILGFGVVALSMLPMALGIVNPITAFICMGVGTMAYAMHGSHFVSLFPAQYANVGSVSLVASLTDSLCYVGSAVGSLLAGVLIEGWGYGTMYAVMAALSVAGMLALILIYKNRKA